MARIYPLGSEICDAVNVRNEFRRRGRDYYCDEVYQYIFAQLQEDPSETTELDVIGWCGTIGWVDYHESTNEDGDIIYVSDDGVEYDSAADLVSSIRDVIYHDAEVNRVYYNE